MTWDAADTWAKTLDVNGVKGWRLPTMMDTGAPGCDYAFTGTDCGYNVQTGSAATTVYSEVASLFYDTLGNLAIYDTSGAGPQSGYGLANTGPFSNLQSDVYWSGLEYAPNPGAVWYFYFTVGVPRAAPPLRPVATMPWLFIPAISMRCQYLPRCGCSVVA